MGGKTSSTPAPDYTGAATATAAGNLQNLQYQTQANRPNVTTPWGTDSWTAPDATGKSTETIALSPDQQQALTAQQNISNNQSQLGQTLQGQVASTMANGFQAPSLSSYMSGVGSVNQNYGGFNPTGVGGVNQNFGSTAQDVNTNASGAVAPAGTANQSTPQFSNATAQAGAQSAYGASHSLIADQQQQDTKNLDSQLRLQGLTPGTEAYNNASQNLQRTQDQQNNNLASAAVQTGNNEANQNYASSLAGYNSNLGAQQQAYNQGANTFALGNSALSQQYGQDANSYSLGNTAQGQAYNQSLAGYGANQTAQQNSNAAQQQAYAQAQGSYNTAYSSALQNYLQPLNSMNAVLNGNQVSMPSFGNYATAGTTPGTDYTTAANLTGQYNSAQNAASNASSSSTMGTIGSLASAAMIAY